jgi:membrane protein implicated in regulation of membrane protease activity
MMPRQIAAYAIIAAVALVVLSLWCMAAARSRRKRRQTDRRQDNEAVGNIFELHDTHPRRRIASAGEGESGWVRGLLKNMR